MQECRTVGCSNVGALRYRSQITRRIRLCDDCLDQFDVLENPLVEESTWITEPVGEGRTGQVCPHYWVIERADGPESKGRCRICGEMREFKNTLSPSDWSRPTSTSAGAAPHIKQ